jgi:serine/threonine-protein kinase
MGGQVKLIDFGQSAPIHQAKPRIQGTIDYIAPEQVQRATLDQRTDVFGLGAALHRVVTGRPIPTEMNQTVSLNSQSLVGKRIAQTRPAPLPELPNCVARLMDDCCQSKPQDRLPDMPALIERLELARTILARHSAPSAGFEGEFIDSEHRDDLIRADDTAITETEKELASPHEAPEGDPPQ